MELQRRHGPRRALPRPGGGPRLATLTQPDPPVADPLTNSTTAYWTDAFARLTGTLRLREAMHAELTRPPACARA